MLQVLDLFSGIGGFALGLERTGGFRTAAFCELDAYCRAVLRRHWPDVPCFEDVREVTGAAIRSLGRIDMVCGGFPCQPHSVAGKRRGIEDDRWLWPEMLRIIRELRPTWVLVENVPGIRTTAADIVLADLEAAGYTCWPLVVGAWAVGAPHRRDRVWFLAHPDGDALRDEQQRMPRRRAGAIRHEGQAKSRGCGKAMAHADGGGLEGERLCGLLDGQRKALGNHAHGCDGPAVAHAIRPGLEGRSSEPRDDAAECAAAQRSRGLWPAGRGVYQHPWEEPRTVESEVDAPVDGLSARLVRFGQRNALRAAGNAVVPQLVEVIGRAILAMEDLTP